MVRRIFTSIVAGQCDEKLTSDVLSQSVRLLLAGKTPSWWKTAAVEYTADKTFFLSCEPFINWCKKDSTIHAEVAFSV